MAEIEVAALHYYPIKSCAGTDAESVALSEYGIEHDREWMLINAKGQFQSQRQHPELAVVQAHIENYTLVAEAPGMGALHVPLEQDPNAAEVSVTFWKKPGTGFDQGTEANAYFSDYLHEDVRLLRVAQPRSIKPECRIPGASERTGFADGFPMLLGNLASLDLLNGHMDQPVLMSGFRTNIDVKGAPAYDEDFWREVKIGNLRAFIVRACARCPIPNIDQRTGVLPDDRPVTSALHATRNGKDHIGGGGGDYFGQNVTHEFKAGTEIRVGDHVTIVRRSPERNIDLAIK